MCLVIVQEKEKGLEASVILSSDKREYNLVSILRVKSYREGAAISNLYNQMLSKGIRVSNLYKIVNAVKLLSRS